MSENCPSLVRRAFRASDRGHPAPSPSRCLRINSIRASEAAVSCISRPQCRQAPSYRNRPADGDLDLALEAILAAGRPLIVAGGGANPLRRGSCDRRHSANGSASPSSHVTGQGVIRDDHERHRHHRR